MRGKKTQLFNFHFPVSKNAKTPEYWNVSFGASEQHY